MRVETAWHFPRFVIAPGRRVHVTSWETYPWTLCGRDSAEYGNVTSCDLVLVCRSCLASSKKISKAWALE